MERCAEHIVVLVAAIISQQQGLMGKGVLVFDPFIGVLVGACDHISHPTRTFDQTKQHDTQLDFFTRQGPWPATICVLTFIL